MPQPVQVTAMTCPRCGDTIFSRAHHDFRSCSCGGIHIDGGFDYVKAGWDPEIGDCPRSFGLLVTASKKELYDDWNKRKDQFGLIPPSVELAKVELTD